MSRGVGVGIGWCWTPEEYGWLRRKPVRLGSLSVAFLFSNIGMIGGLDHTNWLKAI